MQKIALKDIRNADTGYYWVKYPDQPAEIIRIHPSFTGDVHFFFPYPDAVTVRHGADLETRTDLEGLEIYGPIPEPSTDTWSN